MITFVRFYLGTFKQIKKYGFSKVHKIFLKKVLDYSCAHVLRKGTSKWALD
jgi:hypothetical protein